MTERNDFIDSSKAVIKHIKENEADEDDQEDDEVVYIEAEVCKIMRELGYRYRKVHHVALSANSNRSLVLR